jgi:general stress protein 26
METTTASALDHLTEIICGIDVAMLTTVDRTGHLHSRPMMTLRKPADGALWFFTQGHSHMVDDVNGHHPVNISYVDSAQGRYVSVSGRARVVNDRAKKEELWERRLGAWLPDGFEDSSVVLLRVEVQEAESWESNNDREITATIEFGKHGVRNEKLSFR